MTRRHPRGIEYAAAVTSLPGLSVLFDREGSIPEPNEEQLVPLRRLPYLAWRLWNARSAKKQLDDRETKLKQQINAILDEAPAGVRGVVGRFGARTSMRLLQTEVKGHDPINPQSWVKYLGPHTQAVVKSVDLPMAQMSTDPIRFTRLVAFIAKLYGSEMASAITLTIDKRKLEALQKAGELPAEPEGLWQETAGHPRLDAKPVA